MLELPENTFLEHLEALRWCLLRCLFAVAIAFIPGYLLAPELLSFLLRFCLPAELLPLNYFSPLEVFLVQLKLGGILAIFIASPYIAWQVWSFLLPALYAKERWALQLWLGWATVLFLAGAGFCLVTVLPLLLKFSAGFAGTELRPMLGLANFQHLAGILLFSFGLMFQAPLAVLLCVRFKLLSCATLSHSRPYIIVGILMLSAVLTPPDVLSQLLLALPTWLLFELALGLAKYCKL
ncbi:MAG: twin-arginine translocase subunit TatC [Lentisphaeria bacterium]